MADELLIRERVEIERRRDDVRRLDRVHAVEKGLDVLRARIDGWLERAVSGDDLKELKREMEAEMNKQISHICEHFDSQTKQQSADILNRVEGMFDKYHSESTTTQLEQSRALLSANADTRREIIRYGIGFALTVLSALTVFYFTRNG